MSPVEEIGVELSCLTCLSILFESSPRDLSDSTVLISQCDDGRELILLGDRAVFIGCAATPAHEPESRYVCVGGRTIGKKSSDCVDVTMEARGEVEDSRESWRADAVAKFAQFVIAGMRRGRAPDG